MVSDKESNFLQAAKSSLAMSPHWYIEDHDHNNNIYYTILFLILITL